MAEGGGLLNRYTPQRRIEGSNPSVSARGSSESASNQFQTQFQNQFQPPVSSRAHARPAIVKETSGQSPPQVVEAKNKTSSCARHSDKYLINNNYV